MEKIKIQNDVLLKEALNVFATSVYIECKKYKFLPFWFELDGSDIYIHKLGSLPEELVKHIKNNRLDVVE